VRIYWNRNGDPVKSDCDDMPKSVMIEAMAAYSIA
jgi:hypothetical protein